MAHQQLKKVRRTFCGYCSKNKVLAMALDNAKAGDPKDLMACIHKATEVKHSAICIRLMARALDNMLNSDIPEVDALLKEAMALKAIASELWAAIRDCPEGIDASSYEMAYEASKASHWKMKEAMELDHALNTGLTDKAIPIDWDEPDEEKILNEVIELQARQDKGMVMIQAANVTIQGFFKAHGWMGLLYNAWRGHDSKDVPMPEIKRAKFLNDKRNVNYLKWFDYRKSLWDQWNKLRDEANQKVSVLENPAKFWPVHFYSLKDQVFDPYWINVEGRSEIREDLYDILNSVTVQGDMHMFELSKDEEWENKDRYEVLAYEVRKGKPHDRYDVDPQD